MTRPRRCEFPGALHLVSICGPPGGQVFYAADLFRRFPDNPRAHAPHVEVFEELLWDACEQYDALIHAYVTEPNAALIVLQSGGAPLSWLMHDLLLRYARQLRGEARTPAGERLFPRRYKAQLLQPAKLPYAVRHVQRREVPGARRRAAHHPFSSGLIYCGRKPRPARFVVSALRAALEPLGYVGPGAYFEFMAQRDSPAIADLLARPVIGERGFRQSVCERCRTPARTPSPEDLLREVTCTVLHTQPGVACASTHRGALARALVAWYAMRTGAARIGTVGGWFGVTSSDLRHLIERHRRAHPRYFALATPELFPDLAAVPPGATPRAPPTRAAGGAA
ncbi:MAG: hypothetical protein ACYCUE_08380 [Steroidobacteraceae bacterium]